MSEGKTVSIIDAIKSGEYRSFNAKERIIAEPTEVFERFNEPTRNRFKFKFRAMTYPEKKRIDAVLSEHSAKTNIFDAMNAAGVNVEELYISKGRGKNKKTELNNDALSKIAKHINVSGDLEEKLASEKLNIVKKCTEEIITENEIVAFDNIAPFLSAVYIEWLFDAINKESELTTDEALALG